MNLFFIQPFFIECTQPAPGGFKLDPPPSCQDLLCTFWSLRKQLFRYDALLWFFLFSQPNAAKVDLGRYCSINTSLHGTESNSHKPNNSTRLMQLSSNDCGLPPLCHAYGLANSTENQKWRKHKQRKQKSLAINLLAPPRRILSGVLLASWQVHANSCNIMHPNATQTTLHLNITSQHHITTSQCDISILTGSHQFHTFHCQKDRRSKGCKSIYVQFLQFCSNRKMTFRKVTPATKGRPSTQI